jgi:hypothetical protein
MALRFSQSKSYFRHRAHNRSLWIVVKLGNSEWVYNSVPTDMIPIWIMSDLNMSRIDIISNHQIQSNSSVWKHLSPSLSLYVYTSLIQVTYDKHGAGNSALGGARCKPIGPFCCRFVQWTAANPRFHHFLTMGLGLGLLKNLKPTSEGECFLCATTGVDKLCIYIHTVTYIYKYN